MNNRTELLEEMYRQSMPFFDISLDEEQRVTLIKEIRELHDKTLEYLNIITDGGSYIDVPIMVAFQSYQITETIVKSYKNFDEITRNKNNDLRTVEDKYSSVILKELENNRDLFTDRLKFMEKEQVSLIGNLKDYKPYLPENRIIEKVFFLKIYAGEIIFLLSAVRSYLYRNGESDCYESMYILADALREKTSKIIKIYLSWMFPFDLIEEENT